MSRLLALSLFPGIDGLGLAFQDEWPELCIVRGPDVIFGSEWDVRTFHPPAGIFAGVWGGPPCFPAETLVLTARGPLSIAAVTAEDLVLTHQGRWQRVLHIGSKVADTVVARGQGARLEGTANHPIWTRDNFGSRDARGVLSHRRGARRQLAQPQWAPLGESSQRFWATPAQVDGLPCPALPRGLRNRPAFWWMVGRWLGDGWIRLRLGGIRSVKGTVTICCAQGEAQTLAARLETVGPLQLSLSHTQPSARRGQLRWRLSKERTGVKLHTESTALALWLTDHFGRGAAGKRIPGWALSLPEPSRQALLDGYFSADGNTAVNSGALERHALTVSKALAVGVRLLAETLGNTTRLHYHEPPAYHRIEGRVVNQRSWYRVSWRPGATRSTQRDAAHTWGLIRSVAPGRQGVRVYNLEVEDDNSYVADGIVVHNCQTFSPLARLVRAQGKEPRFGNLIPEFERIVEEAEPEWWLMENVPSAPEPSVAGYLVYHQIVDNRWFVDPARDDGVGAEQRRKRRISFGTRDGRPLMLDVAALQSPVQVMAVDGLDLTPSERDRARAVMSGNGFDSGAEYAKRMGGGDGTAAHSYRREISATVHTRASLKGMGSYSVWDGRSDKVKITATSVTSSGVLEGQQQVKARKAIAGAVTSSDGGASARMARYTVQEACVLQGFPPDFLADSPFTQSGRLKAIANAVARPTGRAIARAVQRAMLDQEH